MSDVNADGARRALVICAHDDDEVIGVGGTIRALVDAGVEVTTLVFATGAEGYAKLDEKETIAATRASERACAGTILGTQRYIAHDYGDFSNLDCGDVYHKVMKAVRGVRPDLVFSHLPTDYIAHRTLSRLVPEALLQAGWNCSLDDGDPWIVNRLYQFSVLELVPRPSHIVDITRTWQAKVEAMSAYGSQVKVVPRILDEMEAKARVYGSLVGVKYGEAFLRSQSIPLFVDQARDLLRCDL